MDIQRNKQSDFINAVHFWSKDTHLVKEVFKHNHGSLHISETNKATLILERDRRMINYVCKVAVRCMALSAHTE